MQITHGRVLRISVPIVLSNATVPFLGLVNTGVIGQLGAAAPVGAVGIGAVILAAVYWLFGFLRMGTTGLVAQAHGRGDKAEVSAALWRALVVATCAGVTLILVQGPLFWGAFALAPASDQVESLARSYLSVRIWGAPATIGLYALNGWLIGVERTKALLILQLFMNGLNILLDVWFVLGLGWGVPGVAVATLIAEWSGLIFALWLARSALAVRLRWPVVFDRVKLHKMVAVNTDIMIRSIMLQGCFTAFLFLGAGEGDVILAANQVLLQFMEITAYLLDGFAFAAEALVGQAVGARAVDDLRRGAIICTQWAMGGVLVLGAGFALGGPFLIDALTTDPAVQQTARIYLPWLVFAPLAGVAGWMFDGIFVGATRSREMRNTAIIAAVVFTVTVVLATPMWGNHGLWVAIMLMNITRGIVMAFLYPRVEASAA